MDKDHELRIKGKCNFFLEEKIKVHVERLDKSFWNGHIIGKKSDDIFVFKEVKLGILHLFVSDVYDIEEFREVGG